jgi:hypothetical protein
MLTFQKLEEKEEEGMSTIYKKYQEDSQVTGVLQTTTEIYSGILQTTQ